MASATAAGGETNAAYASAVGINVQGYGDATDGAILSVDIENSGSSIRVFASASADGPGVANANAIGIHVEGGFVTGTIDNFGLIQATAVATGGGDYATDGPFVDGVGRAEALAVGINVIAGSFAGDINVNGGTVIAVASGPTASAVGIRIAALTREAAYTTTGPGTGYTTGYTDPAIVFPGTGTAAINVEDATIWAGVFNDGDLSWGNAIDVSLSPNPVDINLDGNVDIFGNILLSDDDIVNVNGQVFFDGAINPGTTLAAVGVVNVGAAATLTIANNSVVGPAQINVGEFNQVAGGIVVFEVRGEDGSDFENSAGSIFAQTANLAGTAIVRLLTGLYDDTTYSSVVVSPNLNGAWANVELDRDYLFLDIEAVENWRHRRLRARSHAVR